MLYKNKKLTGYADLQVRSRAIRKMLYEFKNGSLSVTFVKGSVYRYYHVPAKVFYEMLLSDSIGKYFIRNIRDKYNYSKL